MDQTQTEATVRWDWTEDELWLIQMAVGFCTNRQMEFCDRISQKEYKKPDGSPFTEKEVHDAWVMYHRYVNVGNKVREQYQAKKKANEGRMDTKDTLIAGAFEQRQDIKDHPLTKEEEKTHETGIQDPSRQER